jgi:GNAT superfamily N-acetyltransferase
VSASPVAAGSPLLVDVGLRWQGVDSLLPTPELPAPAGACDAMPTVAGADGQLRAIGMCEHWRGDPEALDLTWGAAWRFQFTARVMGPDVAAHLDGLLGLWRAHLTGTPEAADPDTAAVVLWPSRDIDGVGTLLQHGFAPRGVIAARRGELAARTPRTSAPTNARVRRAGPRDIDAVVRLGLEVVRYDAHFGGVVERLSTPAALRAELAGMLAEPEPWIWLAERDGSAVGVLIAEPPPAQWIAPLIGAAPVAYNMLTFVAPADRGSGLAAALVRRFHNASAAAAVPVTLLHYEQTNPLSAPFWARQGYRPLWTSWEARPACTMR